MTTQAERSLQRQLRDTQDRIPQLTLQASAASSARDQAEATLRTTRTELNTLVDLAATAVTAGVVAGDATNPLYIQTKALQVSGRGDPGGGAPLLP